MRILYIDIDTLRADHLGCYGYHRNTSPNLDRLAKESVRFEHCYVSDAPCQPSRAALWTGQFGIHNGVVEHENTAGDLPIQGKGRGFHSRHGLDGLCMQFRKAGLYTASVSPFGERHSAWWFYAGFREMHNTGRHGHESAEEITPLVLDWVKRNGSRDNWFLHVNIWDPHTPYRAPKELGNPFENVPPPSWMTQETIDKHLKGYSPHGAACPSDPGSDNHLRFPRMPGEIRNMQDYKKWVDGYDCGIFYADQQVGQYLEALKQAGVLEDTVVIVSSDHGENQGELAIYGDHHTADSITSRVPFLIRWPDRLKSGVNAGLHYQGDLFASVIAMLGREIPAYWDFRSVAPALEKGETGGRDYLVISQNVWACQRSVRWDNWLLMRTYDTGIKEFPEYMLFDVKADPHLTRDLTPQRPLELYQGIALLEQWTGREMSKGERAVDPLWTVVRDGGPGCTGSRIPLFIDFLRQRGLHAAAEKLARLGPWPEQTDLLRPEAGAPAFSPSRQ